MKEVNIKIAFGQHGIDDEFIALTSTLLLKTNPGKVVHTGMENSQKLHFGADEKKLILLQPTLT